MSYCRLHEHFRSENYKVTSGSWKVKAYFAMGKKASSILSRKELDVSKQYSREISIGQKKERDEGKEVKRNKKWERGLQMDLEWEGRQGKGDESQL